MIVANRSDVARNIFVFFLGFKMWRIVIKIRIENATTPMIALLMPRMFVYWEFWTVAQEDVSMGQIVSGVRARRVEKIREIVKRVRMILYFILLLGWICL